MTGAGSDERAWPPPPPRGPAWAAWADAPTRVLVMGVVNVTPDSFSDGGRYLDPAAAIAHGRQLLDDGADLLDVGGEATNPRAQAVTEAEELRRVLPVIEALAAAGAVVSIDTTKAAVARAALAAGAQIVNDVSGGLFDPALPHEIGAATYIVGHLRGRSIAEVFAAEGPGARTEPTEPAARTGPTGGDARTAPDALDAADAVDAVIRELRARLAALPPAVREAAWVDPGLGFGKGADPAINLALLSAAGAIGRALARPVVIGASRKRFVRRAWDVADGDPAALDAASTAATLRAVAAGANVVRVHNVALLRAQLALYTR